MIGPYASAGAWGARNGPAFIRRLLDRERAGTYVALILVDLALVAISATVQVALLLVTRNEPLWLRSLGVGGFALVTAGAVMWLVEAVSRWWWSGRRPGRLVLSPAPSGAVSTAVPRSRAALATPLTNAVLITAWCVFMVVLTAGVAWVAALVGLLAFAAGSRLLPFVLGRVSPGGVYLTPTAIELRWGVRSTSVPWEAVTGEPDDLAHGLHGAEELAGTRTFPVDIPLDVTDRPAPGRVAVPVAYLSVSGPALTALIGWYAARPDLRVHLGTLPSLEWRPTAPSAVTMADDDPFR